MIALSTRSRAALVAVAGAGYLAAFGVAAGPPTSAAADAGDPASTPPAIRAAANAVPLLLPRTDPFARDRVVDRPAAPDARHVTAIVPAIPSPPALPAGILAASGAPRVAAIVSGPPPYALVASGSTVSVVGVGDPLGGSTVVAIGSDGLRLRDGTTLRVASDGRSP